jgi:hypothetical protein
MSLRLPFKIYNTEVCFCLLLPVDGKQSATLSEQPVSEQDAQGGSDRSQHVALQQLVIIGVDQMECNIDEACGLCGRENKCIDMDMSYARRVRTASLTSYSVSCKILHQRTASHS